jgi:hypothetical protein
VLLIMVVMPFVVIVAIELSGPLVWTGLTLVALACVALYIWRRRVDEAAERAWVGAFSFGDVMARREAKEALEGSAREPTSGRIAGRTSQVASTK